MKKILMASAVATAIMLTGCGGGGSYDGRDDDHMDEHSVELTFLMFDNVSSDQYSYDSEHGEVEDLNVEGENYDMTGKSGKLVVWTHHMEDEDGNETEEQKVMMLNDVDYNILNDGNVTYENFHYLGHFHTNEETNESEFAAHSAVEFSPDNINEAKQDALNSLNTYLLEREEVREELEEALLNVRATGDLCNFIVLGEHEEHEEEEVHEEEEEEHGAPHIALTSDGYVYVFEVHDENGTHELEQDGIHFLLDGVTECIETESDMIPVGDHGVAIFSADSQKIYMVDKHEDEASTYSADFHVHSTVEISDIMPAGFTPTSVVAIGEGEHDHDHDH